METQIDLLTPDEHALFTIWEDFFASPGWRLLMQRYQPRLEATIGELEASETMKALGQAQGRRDMLREFTDLETIMEYEFNSTIAVAQAERQDDMESRGAMA